MRLRNSPGKSSKAINILESEGLTVTRWLNMEVGDHGALSKSLKVSRHESWFRQMVQKIHTQALTLTIFFWSFGNLS